MALATFNVAYTIIGEIAFGRICVNSSLVLETPITRQALQYSSFLTICTSPRTTRAKLGILPIPMAMITLISPCPSTVIRIMDNKTNGNERKPSIIRMIIESTIPPMKPAIRPSSTPMIPPTNVPPAATISETLAP